MENLDDIEKDVAADSVQLSEFLDAAEAQADTPKQNKKKGVESDGKYKDCFQFFSIEPLDFHQTPQRNKELHRFHDTLKAPFVNIPLLIAERQEDILPVLSLYTQGEEKIGKETSFFSVTPSDFKLDDDSDYSREWEERINMGATIIEEQPSGSLPVYCDLVEYMDRDIFDRFVLNFFKKDMPAVLCVNKKELEDIHHAILQDRQTSGGIENPEAPYELRGLARTKEIEIAPLTREEKHIYFSHHLNRMARENKLKCPESVCRYFVNQMLNRFSHQEVFFKVFDLMNQAVVLTQKMKQPTISKSIINKVLKEQAPLHSRTKSLMDLDIQTAIIFNVITYRKNI